MSEPQFTIDPNPIRYDFAPRPLKGRKGMTKRNYWQERKTDSELYNDALYERTLVINHSWTTPIPNHLIP